MSIGLDLGSTQFRSLRSHGDRLVGRTCRVQILTVPDTPAHRRLLDHDRVSYAECEGSLHILGDATLEWSKLMSRPCRRLISDGQLPHDDPIARQILSMMVDAVLPPAQSSGEICCLTIPGELLPDESTPERGFFTQLVRLRGYLPLISGQGHAAVLAELGKSGFSGLGISLGATQCEFSLNRSGREIARCAIPWGADELSQHSDSMALENPSAANPLADFLVEMLLEAGARIEQHDGFRILSQPVTVVIAGGMTALPGFQHICQQAWQRAAWPLRLDRLIVSGDSTYTIARGCLIRSVLASQVELVNVAA